jgi:hypothetical protein
LTVLVDPSAGLKAAFPVLPAQERQQELLALRGLLEQEVPVPELVQVPVVHQRSLLRLQEPRNRSPQRAWWTTNHPPRSPVRELRVWHPFPNSEKRLLPKGSTEWKGRNRLHSEQTE